MAAMGSELLISSMVAGTVGFSGAQSPLSYLARALAVVLFAGFIYTLLMSAAEARTSKYGGSRLRNTRINRAEITP